MTSQPNTETRPGQLRLELAKRLGRVFYDRATIVSLVQGNAPELETEELRLEGSAFTIWMRILSDLTRRQAFQSIENLFGLLEAKDKSVRRSVFVVLFSPEAPVPSVPGGPPEPEWVRHYLDVHWRDERNGDVRETTKITGQDGTLSVVLVQEWSGRRPSAPSLIVETSRLLAPVEEVRPALEALASDQRETTWIARIPYESGHFRTRRIKAKVESEGRVRVTRYVIPPAGWLFSAVLWFACAALMWWRARPLVPSVFVPLGVLHFAQGGWSLFVAPALQQRGRRAWLQQWFSIWERVVPIAMAVLLLTMLLPRFVVVLINSTTARIELADGAKWLAPKVREIAVHAPWTHWAPPKLRHPFCVCGADPNCSCGDEAVGTADNRLVFGCIAGDCNRTKIEVHTTGGDAVIEAPRGLPLRPIAFAPGTLSKSLLVLDRGVAVVAIVAIKQTGAFRLNVAPLAAPFKLDFSGLGMLVCPRDATRVVGLKLGVGNRTSSAAITITYRSVTSTWLGSTTEVRACADNQTSGDLEITFPELGRITCDDTQVDEIALLKLSQPVASLSVTGNGVTTNWEAEDDNPSYMVPFCMKSTNAMSGGTLVLELSTANSELRVTMPSDVSIGRVGISSGTSVVWTPCQAHEILRTLRFSNVDGVTFPLTHSHTTITRVDARRGITCGADIQVKVAGKVCKLSDNTFACSKRVSEPVPCSRYNDGRIVGIKVSDPRCKRARAADAQTFRRQAKKNYGLSCTDEIYTCGFHP